MIKNFTFNDIVLYAKGWYARSENIVADLGYLLSKIYGWTPTREHDVAKMMLRALDKLYIELDLPRDSCAWKERAFSHGLFVWQKSHINDLQGNEQTRRTDVQQKSRIVFFNFKYQRNGRINE